MLQDEHGEEQIDHNVKAAILWRVFKNRLGVCLQPELNFDLNNSYSITWI
jgi:hypothetical protein